MVSFDATFVPPPPDAPEEAAADTENKVSTGETLLTQKKLFFLKHVTFYRRNKKMKIDNFFWPSGTDVMILKKISPNFSAKKGHF
jgi:hypothetical protein